MKPSRHIGKVTTDYVIGRNTGEIRGSLIHDV